MVSSSSAKTYDAILLGGGVAGVSLAYFLADQGMTRVLLLEQEAALAHHASGRSAQVLLELERDLVVHRLIVEGGRFLRQPPPGFSECPLFHRTGILLMYDAPEWAEMCRHVPAWRAAGTAIELLEPQEALARVPVLEGGVPPAGALWLPECGRLDVRALIAAYAKHARAAGVEIRTRARVDRLWVEAGRCQGVELDGQRIAARWVVNAAGPWAGQVGLLAGATPVTFHPLRRSVVCLERPHDAHGHSLSAAGWPMVSCPSRRLYFASEGDGVLACPMDETLCTPQDIGADPSDIARALERLADIAPGFGAVRVRSTRAGLRTFASDRRFVVGEDPRRPGFFWLAGQGGWGIETSPALGRLAAERIVHGTCAWPDAIDVARFAS